MDILRNIECRTNESLNCTIQSQQLEKPLPPLFISVITIGILALLINGGVFILFIKKKTMRKNPYYFLVFMLSVSDFTVGLGVLCIIPPYLYSSLKGSKILTVMQMVLMTTGLYLSLLQTFLISLQRFLVICKGSWNLLIFRENRKYFVCFGGWLVVVIINFILISPPSREFDPGKDRFLPYVYHGHYLAHTVYTKALTLSLLSLTIILYLKTVRHVLKYHKKVDPIDVPNTNSRVKTINVEMAQSPSCSLATDRNKQSKQTITTDTDKNSKRRPKHENNQQLQSTVKRKKIVSTLYSVGLLIVFLIFFTGPFIMAFWIDNSSSRFMGIVFCLYILNSVANPFIYVWKLVNVPSFLKQALCCFSH